MRYCNITTCTWKEKVSYISIVASQVVLQVWCCICLWLMQSSSFFFFFFAHCTGKQKLLYQGLSQAAPLRQSCTAIEISLKKTVKGTICPLQNLGKKLERKHTRRVLSRYRNCKLKQNVESIFSCTFKVHSKVTFQSHFTEQVHLMLNQAWWTHVAIFTMLFTNMRTQKFKRRLHNYVFRCPQS